jgi:hypothetical protein
MPTEVHAKKAASGTSRPATALSDPNLIAIVQFCAIGLLVMLIAILSFPDLGAIIAQFNQF